MKNAAVITCFESNEERTSFVIEALQDRGYNTIGVSTDFSHITKKTRSDKKDHYVQIKTMPYKRNLSIERLLSHRNFAKKAFEFLDSFKPDIIWVCVPANSLISEAKKYKDRHPEVKIIIDVIDMWPESMPLGTMKKLLPFTIWRNIRDDSIDCADALVTECSYYKNILKDVYHGELKTIHWARDNKVEDYPLDLPKDKLSLAYIGSINNIIDIDEIGRLIDSCDMPVVLHVIGAGESKERLLDTLKSKCELIYYGVTYDPEDKKRIFSKCHAGLNIYKEGLYIGLTVKSIDYFNYGLPIINSIKGDTHSLINDYGVGFNVDKDSRLDAKAIIDMRLHNENVLNVYRNYFTKEVFIKRLNEVVDSIE